MGHCRRSIIRKGAVLLFFLIIACGHDVSLPPDEKAPSPNQDAPGLDSSSGSGTSPKAAPIQDLILSDSGNTAVYLSDYEQNKALVISQDNPELDKVLKYHEKKEEVVHLLQILRDEIVPQAVKVLVERFPQTFGYLKEKDIGIGLQLNDSTAATKALFSMKPMYTDGRPEESVWMIYSLTISYGDLKWTGSQLDDFWRKELEKNVTHEMMHALMCEALTCGFSKWDCKLNQHGDSFPTWFVEGTAETVSAGSSRVSYSNGLNITSETTPQEITDILTKYPLTGDSVLSKYGTGYLAVMYLSHLAAAGTSYDAANLAQGLDTLMSRIHVGESLDGVIKSISRNQFEGLKDFESKFASSGADFVAQLMDVLGAGRGDLRRGVLLSDDYYGDDLLPNARHENRLFWLNILKDEYTNKFNDQLNAPAVFKGGSATRQGVPGPASTRQGRALPCSRAN